MREGGRDRDLSTWRFGGMDGGVQRGRGEMKGKGYRDSDNMVLIQHPEIEHKNPQTQHCFCRGCGFLNLSSLNLHVGQMSKRTRGTPFVCDCFGVVGLFVF